MNVNEATLSTKLKVGIFAVVAIAIFGVFTVFVNDRPYFWRKCQQVTITVEDATGLKMKSPVKSLGIEIGYLENIRLEKTQVRLQICITAPVEILPETRAFIKGEGFLGDKYVELRPVKYLGDEEAFVESPIKEGVSYLYDLFIPSVEADDAPVASSETKVSNHNGRVVPVGQSQDLDQTIKKVNSLVQEVTDLATNMKEALNPEEVRKTLQQLNSALENATKTLSPEGQLTTTAQRALTKLEDAIEQLRDQLSRVNRGEGSVGRILNDPIYADLLEKALKRVNNFLARAADVQFRVNVGGMYIYKKGGRGWGQLGIWPDPDRYYLLGVSQDPDGKYVETVTKVNGSSTTATQQFKNEIVITAMLGKVLWTRLELAMGLLHGKGTLSVALWLGPENHENSLWIRDDVYVGDGDPFGIDNRVTVHWNPFWSVYVNAGIEGFTSPSGSLPFFAGAGVSFNDDDIKLVFTFL